MRPTVHRNEIDVIDTEVAVASRRVHLVYQWINGANGCGLEARAIPYSSPEPNIIFVVCRVTMGTQQKVDESRGGSDSMPENNMTLRCEGDAV